MRILICIDISTWGKVNQYQHHMSMTTIFHAPIKLTYIENGYLVRDLKPYSVRCSMSSEFVARCEGHINIYEKVFRMMYRSVGGVLREWESNYIFVYPDKHTYFKL